MYINPLRISEQEFWDYCATAVCGYVKRVFPDFFRHEDLQDLTSVTATKAWLAADSYDFTKGPVYPWIWKIAKNVVLTNVARLIRERGRFASLDGLQDSGRKLPDALDPVPAADSQLLTEELETTLFGKLTNERDRQLFCWLVEGLDDDEVANRLNASKQTVYTAVCRLRQRLKNAA